MHRKKVVIVIEVANRELDNALLLKAELEKRGYDVSIMSKTEQLRIQTMISIGIGLTARAEKL